MLHFKNISHRFNSDWVLKSINLQIESGRTNVLIGPSGCGKSTLLRIAIGLIWPVSGMVTFDEEKITRDNITKFRKQIGYVIQDGGLFPHLTAFHNLTLLPKYLNWSEDKIKSRIEQLTHLTRFPKEGLKQYPSQLSGGQKQRVSLMRALMTDPKVLFLDESLGSLDPIIRAEMQSDLKHIFDELQKTVIWVTHDMGEAAYMGNRIILMKDGEIVQDDAMENIIQNPANDFVAKFINAQRSPLEGIPGCGNE